MHDSFTQVSVKEHLFNNVTRDIALLWGSERDENMHLEIFVNLQPCFFLFESNFLYETALQNLDVIQVETNQIVFLDVVIKSLGKPGTVPVQGGT